MTVPESPARRRRAAPQPIAGIEPDGRPPLTLLLGPAGAGKTEWALERFLQPDTRPLLIVSSPEQAQTRAVQIAARSGRPDAEIRSAILPFRSFATEIARSARQDGFSTIGRAFQRLVLADLCATAIDKDGFLGRMRSAPGFAAALAERIREWKLACLTPDLLEASAPEAALEMDDPVFAVKAQELARLFRAYETFLTRNRLRDEEDCLRLAAKAAAGTSPLLNNANLVLVDGFYRFNRAQRQLLAALAGRRQQGGRMDVEVAVTLPYAPCRPLLFAAPERTLRLLRAEFTTREIVLESRPADRPAPLALLSDRIFAPEPMQGSASRMATERHGSPVPSAFSVAIRDSGRGGNPTPKEAEALTIFDAPNPYVEAEMVARAFRRLYAEGGYAWSDFAIILRAMGDYAPILSAVFERYGIPLGADGPEILAENPLLKTLLHLFAVVRSGWQREDVLAFLKSSYTAPDKLAADALRRRARAAGVREGRERWLALVKDLPAAHPVASTLQEMACWDTRLTQERAAPDVHANWVREMIGAFGLEERIAACDTRPAIHVPAEISNRKAPTDSTSFFLGRENMGGRAERDRVALREALAVLEAVTEMARLSGRAALSFVQFSEDLMRAWQSASALGPSEGDVVRVIEPYDARERPLKVAVVMGLTERVFPRRITEDPFLRDEERVALRQGAGLDLEEQKARADDERFFFYLAVTAPAERLLLSFPRSSEESDTLPSFYLDEVRAVFAITESTDTVSESRMVTDNTEEHGLSVSSVTSASSVIQTKRVLRDRKREENLTPNTQRPPLTVSRTLTDVVPRPEEVVSAGDRLLAACAGLFDPDAEPVSREERLREAASLMQGCLAEETTAAVVRAVVASRRLPRLPRLEDAALCVDFAGKQPVYSVSELETYQRCPFQYLLRHVLRLRPEEEGASPRAQGTLLHAVLRRYFRQLSAGSALPTDLEAMRAELRQILEEIIEQESLDASPHRLRMIQRLLADALDGFAERETRFTPQFGMTPAHFELAFGLGMRPEGLEDEDEREITTDGPLSSIHDPASCQEPLWLSGPDGGPPVAVCGAIDRVDVDATGRRVLLLDYKLGKPPEHAEIQRGASLQMPLYLLAIERLFGKVGAVACYDSMRERGRRRFLRTEHVNLRQFSPLLPLDDGSAVKPLNRDQYEELVKTAETAAVQAARSIAAARIDATPGDYCRLCAYSDICRTTATSGHDGETIPASAIVSTRVDESMKENE
ncbi:MAG TPA: PD-(D/E)XK nuclease family protein [Chthonomonadaceae bacterium]|nr:PD-(D/E)XK nuclease family protein [Chthonomonadaceae bacterium]